MPNFQRGRNLKRWKSNRPPAEGGKLRIVGGKYRGRQIEYSGDPVTRPMKDNIREALFNLIGGWVSGKAAIDLFAGTGAMGLEAVSRGATRAFLIERHFPTVRIIRGNVRTIEPEVPVEVCPSDTFFWAREFLADPERHPAEPWAIFCCPPYDFFVERRDELLQMIEALIEAAPADSIVVVESDDRFDPALLPEPTRWRVRQYAPALISVLRPDPVEADAE
ncbi:MAG: RsmD family RNA methyltransferase [Planctomycetota bacterium]